ncbi:hypothetical protein BH10PSE7_BH10PSE7_21440 [soil metagenome]
MAARPAILLLGENSVVTAHLIRLALPDAEILGLDRRVAGTDETFANFGDTIRLCYRDGRPIIALCAAGIVIRALSTLLESKTSEPPVLAIAEDGSAVVPLLGGLHGVNDLARQIAAALGVSPAITTTGELRFGVNLLNPPAGYTLVNPQAGKRFTSDLLAGEKVRIEGDAPWLADANLPVDPQGKLRIRVASEDIEPRENELVYRARVHGKLSVVGLGPGDPVYLAPAARQALSEATDIVGYEPYVRMAGPFRAGQALHMTDNREEMRRARHAFALAASGRAVAVVSSGDPGIFAMATAVLEALHLSGEPAWHAVDLAIIPGISAALAAAGRCGAPLGHDFCILSLSDNLKPWPVIEDRITHAAAADLTLAFYNPISRERPWQLSRALDLVKVHRDAATLVILARDVTRPAEKITVTTLAEARPEHVDMRTVVIIGSSTTRSFPRDGGGQWVYTPRWYGEQPRE